MSDIKDIEYIYSIRHIGDYADGMIIGFKYMHQLKFLEEEILPKNNIYMICHCDTVVTPLEDHIRACVRIRDKGYKIILDNIWQKKLDAMAEYDFDLISFYQIYNPINFEYIPLQDIKYDMHFAIGTAMSPGNKSKRFPLLSEYCKKYYEDTGKKTLITFGNSGKPLGDQSERLQQLHDAFEHFDFKCLTEKQWIENNVPMCGTAVTMSTVDGGPRLFTHLTGLGIHTVFQEDMIDAQGYPCERVKDYFLTFKNHNDFTDTINKSISLRGSKKLKSEVIKNDLIDLLTNLGYKDINIRDDSYYIKTYNIRKRTIHGHKII